MIGLQVHNPDPRSKVLLDALRYPPARLLSATRTLLGSEDPEIAFTESEEREGRTLCRAVVLTASRIVLTEGEGPGLWELSDGFGEDDTAMARAWRIADLSSVSTIPGKEWTTVETLYSHLGVAMHMRDGTEIRVPGLAFNWNNSGNRDRLEPFVSAVVELNR